MHKSSGNAIEFDEAADRMGVDVMRWMFAKSRPEDNILFGWHAADEARRELLDPVERLLVLRDLRPAGRLEPDRGRAAGRGAARPRSLDPVAGGGNGRRGRGRLARDGRGRRASGAVRLPRRPVDLVPAPVAPAVLAVRRPDATRTRRSRRCTRPSWRRPGCSRRSCRSSPSRSTGTSSRRSSPDAPDSVHLTRWPTAELAAHRDEGLERCDGGRPGGGGPGPDPAQQRRAQDPAAAGHGLDRPAGSRPGARRRAARSSSPTEINVKDGRSSSTTTRRSSSGGSSRCCPRSASASGRRSRRSWPPPGRATSTFEADGSVTLGGVTLAPGRGRDPGHAAPGHRGRRPTTASSWSSTPS